MKKVFAVLFVALMVLAGVAILAGWMWGVPYIAVWLFDANYWFCATVWLSILFIRHGVKVYQKNKELEKLAEYIGGNRFGN